MSSPTAVDNFAKIVVIKRNGADGPSYPLTGKQCVIGRGTECDIRIQLPNVAYQHCRIDVEPDGKIFVVNISNGNTTLNQTQVVKPLEMYHKDILTIIDRSFRIELPEKHRARSPSAESRRSAARLLATTPVPLTRITSASSRASPRGSIGSAKTAAAAAGSPSSASSPGSDDFSPALGSARASRRSSGIVRLARSVSPDANVLKRSSVDESPAVQTSPLVAASERGSRKSLSDVAAKRRSSKSPAADRRRRSAPASAAIIANGDKLKTTEAAADIGAMQPVTGSLAATPAAASGVAASPEVRASDTPRRKSASPAGRAYQEAATPASRRDTPRAITSSTSASRRRSPVSEPTAISPAVASSSKLSGISPRASTVEGRAAVATSPAASGAVAADQPVSAVGRRSSRSPSSPRSAAVAGGAGAGGLGGGSPATDSKSSEYHSPTAGGSKRVRHVPSPAVSASSVRKPSRLRQSMASIHERSLDQRLVESPAAATPTTPSESGEAAASGSPAVVTQQEQPRRSGKRKSADSATAFGAPEADESASVAAKRRRVSFGGQLSPELFDKKLPPATPLRRGATPRRLAVVESPAIGLLKRRSLAAFSSTIVEEADRRSSRSPRRRRSSGDAASSASSSPAVAASARPSSSPATGAGDSTNSADVVDSPVKLPSGGDATSRRGKALVARGSPTSAKHVVIKSPHVPHHEMSEEEKELERRMKAEEGAALLHHLDAIASPLPAGLSTPPALGALSTMMRTSPRGRSPAAAAAAAADTADLLVDAVDSGAAGDASAAVTTPAPRQSASRSPRSPVVSPNAEKSEPVSSMKSPTSAKQSPSSAKKSPTPARKSLASPRKSPASPRKSPASPRKSPASPRKSPASPRKSPASPRKSPASPRKSPASPRKSPASPRKSPVSAASASDAISAAFTNAVESPLGAGKREAVASKVRTPKSPDITKAVALRAIHGKQATPKLPANLASAAAAAVFSTAVTPRRRKSGYVPAAVPGTTPADGSRRKSSAEADLSFVGSLAAIGAEVAGTSATPQPSAARSDVQAITLGTSANRMSSSRKSATLARRTWADVVKGSRRKSLKGNTAALPVARPSVQSRTSTLPSKAHQRHLGRTATAARPATPSRRRSMYRDAAASTGHAESPMTIVITGAGRGKVPKTPESTATGTVVEQTPYADLPPTPAGPGEMIVSPVVPTTPHRSSSSRKSAARRSVGTTDESASPASVVSPISEGPSAGNQPAGNAADVERAPATSRSPDRRSAASKATRKSASLVGVRELLAEPKSSRRSAMLTGVRELLAEPKSSRRSAMLTGVRELLAEPKPSRRSESLVGVRELLAEPRPPRRSTGLAGVKELLGGGTRRSVRSPSLVGVRELLTEPKPERRSTSLTGVRELLNEPKPRKSASLTGVRQLMKSPKRAQDSLSPSGIQRVFATPDDEPATTQQPAAVPAEGGQQPARQQVRSRIAGTKRARLSTDDVSTVAAAAAASLLVEAADVVAARPTKRRKIAPETPAPAEKALPGEAGTPASRRAGVRQKAAAVKGQLREGGGDKAAAADNTAAVVTASSTVPTAHAATADVPAVAVDAPAPSAESTVDKAAAAATDASNTVHAEAKKGSRRRGAPAASTSIETEPLKVASAAAAATDASNMVHAEAKKGSRRRAAPAASTSIETEPLKVALVAPAGGRGRVLRAAEPSDGAASSAAAVADAPQQPPRPAAREPSAVRRGRATTVIPVGDAGAKPEEKNTEASAAQPRNRRRAAATVAELDTVLPASKEGAVAAAEPSAVPASSRRKPARRGATALPTESSSSSEAPSVLPTAASTTEKLAPTAAAPASVGEKQQLPPARRVRGRAVAAVSAEPAVPTAAVDGGTPVNNGKSLPAAEEPSAATAPAVAPVTARRARGGKRPEAATAGAIAPATDTAAVSTAEATTTGNAGSDQPQSGSTRRGRTAKGAAAVVSSVATAASEQPQPVAPAAARRLTTRGRAPPPAAAVAEPEAVPQQQEKAASTAGRRRPARSAAGGEEEVVAKKKSKTEENERPPTPTAATTRRRKQEVAAAEPAAAVVPLPSAAATAGATRRGRALQPAVATAAAALSEAAALGEAAAPAAPAVGAVAVEKDENATGRRGRGKVARGDKAAAAAATVTAAAFAPTDDGEAAAARQPARGRSAVLKSKGVEVGMVAATATIGSVDVVSPSIKVQRRRQVTAGGGAASPQDKKSLASAGRRDRAAQPQPASTSPVAKRVTRRRK